MIPPTQAPTDTPVSRNAAQMDEVEVTIHYVVLLGFLMSSNEHYMLTKLLKLKPPVFLGF